MAVLGKRCGVQPMKTRLVKFGEREGRCCVRAYVCRAVKQSARLHGEHALALFLSVSRADLRRVHSLFWEVASSISNQWVCAFEPIISPLRDLIRIDPQPRIP